MQSPEGLRRATSPGPASRPVGREPDDHDEEPSDPGENIHLPPPTIWPVTVAAGVALAGFGLVTTEVVSIVGLLVMVWGINGWIQELRHEHH
jgi:hypothetical protein